MKKLKTQRKKVARRLRARPRIQAKSTGFSEAELRRLQFIADSSHMTAADLARAAIRAYARGWEIAEAALSKWEIGPRLATLSRDGKMCPEVVEKEG